MVFSGDWRYGSAPEPATDSERKHSWQNDDGETPNLNPAAGSVVPAINLRTTEVYGAHRIDRRPPMVLCGTRKSQAVSALLLPSSTQGVIQLDQCETLVQFCLCQIQLRRKVVRLAG